MSSKHMKYSAKFKLQVIKFAQESNNCAAGHEICINKKGFPGKAGSRIEDRGLGIRDLLFSFAFSQ